MNQNKNYALHSEINKALGDLRIIRMSMIIDGISTKKLDKIIEMLEEIYKEMR
jgi:hypothetical protein